MKKIIVQCKGDLMIAPFLIEVTDTEKNYICKCYKFFNGDNYIVDPLSDSQCLALMYDSLPWYIKLLFKCETLKITYNQYQKNIYI